MLVALVVIVKKYCVVRPEKEFLDIIDWLKKKQICFSKTETSIGVLICVLLFGHNTKIHELDQLAN
jgi:hypothetical protein